VLCVEMNSEVVVAGLEDGRLVAYKTCDMVNPVYQTHDSNSAVLCVRVVGGRVAVGRRDGSVEVYLNGERKVVLSGSDTDAVYGLAVDGESLYAACKDGKVRKYPRESIG